jgi:hypothetical protein
MIVLATCFKTVKSAGKNRGEQSTIEGMHRDGDGRRVYGTGRGWSVSMPADAIDARAMVGACAGTKRDKEVETHKRTEGQSKESATWRRIT